MASSGDERNDNNTPPADDDVLYLDADQSDGEQSLDEILKEAQASADRLAERQRKRADQQDVEAPGGDVVPSEGQPEAMAPTPESDLTPQSRKKKAAPPKGKESRDLALKVADLTDTNESLRSELKEYKDALMRKQAEFENFRKRMERDKEDFKKYAQGSLMKEILPVIDNLERALMVDQKADVESYRQGVELIFKQLRDVLSRFGLNEVVSIGQEFDPNFHEAVATEPSDEFPPNVVVSELQKGYVHHDRLLRAAFVKVSAGPGPAQTEAEESSDSQAEKVDEAEEAGGDKEE